MPLYLLFTLVDFSSVSHQAMIMGQTIYLSLAPIAEDLEPEDPKALVSYRLTGALVTYKTSRNQDTPVRLVTAMDLAMAIAHRVPPLFAFSAPPPPRSVRPAVVQWVPSLSDYCDEVSHLLGLARQEASAQRENLPDTRNLQDVNA